MPRVVRAGLWSKLWLTLSVDVNECICSAVPHNGTCSAVIFLGMLLASFLFFFLFLSLSTSPSTGFTYFYKFAILMWAVVELCWFHQCWCSVVVMCVQYAMLRMVERSIAVVCFYSHLSTHCGCCLCKKKSLPFVYFGAKWRVKYCAVLVPRSMKQDRGGSFTAWDG